MLTKYTPTAMSDDEGYVPRAMRIAAERMSSFARNRFRLETVSTQKAGPGNIITVNLPENSLLHMNSLKMHARVTTNALRDATTNTATGADTYCLISKLPPHCESMISRVEVYLNGVQVQQGTQEYNTICRVLGLTKKNIPYKNSAERAKNHPYMQIDPVVDDYSLVWDTWRGFLNESSTEYLPTDLLGQIQIRITLAGTEVLSVINVGETGTTKIGAGEETVTKDPGNRRVTVFPDGSALPGWSSADNANLSKYTDVLATFNPKYTMSDIYFTIDVCQMDVVYGDMLRKKMAQRGYISLLYKEYYAFQTANITSSTANMRFSLSSGSVDCIYGLLRPGKYQNTKENAIAFDSKNVNGTDSTEENYMPASLAFQTYDKPQMDTDDVNKVDGDLTYRFTVNNVSHPQWQAHVSNAIQDISYIGHKTERSPGTLLQTRKDFNEVNGVFTCLLSVPGEPIGVVSGYDSRGISSQFTFDINNFKAPDSSNGETYAGMLIAETTQELRVAPGKNVAVSH